jgi:hypothetical protein
MFSLCLCFFFTQYWNVTLLWYLCHGTLHSFLLPKQQLLNKNEVKHALPLFPRHSCLLNRHAPPHFPKYNNYLTRMKLSTHRQPAAL